MAGASGVEEVRRLALALPEVSERTSWGRPAWFHARLVARVWDDARLTVRVEDDAERRALVAEDPATFSTTDHHAGSTLVLVALEVVSLADLEVLLRQSWWNAATSALRRRHSHLGPPPHG